MSELACALENFIQRYQINTPSELSETLDSTIKAVKQMIDKEKEIENLPLFNHLIQSCDIILEEKQIKPENDVICEKNEPVVEEVFSNIIPVNDLFPITDKEWDSIPLRYKGRLTLDLTNEVIRIIDELLVKKNDYEAKYFKLNKNDKDKVLLWREYETKTIVGKKWIFQDDVTEMLPQKDKFPFLKYGMDCLRYCKRIQQIKNKGKIIIIIQ